jgi:hypothetical protein
MERSFAGRPPSERQARQMLLRSLLRVSAAAAIALLVSPLAPSAAPAPGVGYDEIVRIVVSATPPPPGNFQADVAALNAPNSQAASPAPRKRGIGLGAIAGAVLGGGGGSTIAGAVAGDVASNVLDNALQQSLGAQFASLGDSIRSFLQPHLIHYAYYNGWERVDDVAAQTATIRKCDIGQVYRLDLAKKTYSIYDPNSEPPATARAATPARSSRPGSAGTPAPPGTAIADISATTRAIGPLRIENQATTGYDATATFAMTQATGSCRNGSASISTVQYISGLSRPAVTSCPIRRAPVPESATEAVTPPEQSGGCRPTIALHTGGPPMPTGKLSLYTLVTMNAAAAATPAPSASGPSGVGFLTERGNIKALGETDVALFSVPADFTKNP